jgi:hypothetical protein
MEIKVVLLQSLSNIQRQLQHGPDKENLKPTWDTETWPFKWPHWEEHLEKGSPQR